MGCVSIGVGCADGGGSYNQLCEVLSELEVSRFLRQLCLADPGKNPRQRERAGSELLRER